MLRPGSRRAAMVAVAALVTTLLSQPALAQYFGRNKVQYKNFKFEVLQTEHFDIYFYPSERDAVQLAARLAERWYGRYRRFFDYDLKGRQPLVLYASHPDFEQTNIIQGDISEGTGGVTEPLRRRIVLPFGGPLADTDHVIGHELVHAFQYDIAARPGAGEAGRGAGLERLPLWFVEGMAEYLSIGPNDPNTAMWLRDAARKEKLPTVKELDDLRYFPYRWGQALLAFIGGRWGDETVSRLLDHATSSGDVAAAIQEVLGISDTDLSNEWHAAIRSAAGPILASTTKPEETGRVIIRAAEAGGQLNVGPQISPDGRWLAFYSERSLFSIDLFVADAKTGQVVRKLTSTATDPHYSSLQFIYSAGAWNATSDRLAVATVTDGKPALAIFRMPDGHRERDIPIDGVDEAFTPTWAPDGHAICFTGLTGGLTDLYLYDLTKSSLRRLTTDAYGDLQPAWSPDGKRIAFATDRFTTQLETLAPGPFRLAILDVDSGEIRPVQAFPNGKHIDPSWSNDGSTLYFIADREGISDVYGVTLATGELRQFTHVSTGVSGITATSPALTVSGAQNLAAFSLYENGKYEIHAVDVSKAGMAPVAMLPSAGVLPPIDRRPSEIAEMLANASEGLPAAAQFPVTPYKGKLGLLAVAQPAIAVGASRFGPAVGGGISMVFSDMLDNNVLAVAAQLNSGITGGVSIKDLAAEAAYVNQARRWNWGVVGGQIPYLSGIFQTGVATFQGQPVQVDQNIVFRQTERSVAGLTSYPFNRARRIELQAGVTQVSFDQIVQTDAFSLATGDRVFSNNTTTSIAESLTLATTSAAFVSDTSVYGATSPVQGERYRFEAAPSIGTINFTSVLADYRRYIAPAPFYTIAFRGLQYGRYGSGSDDPRLFPMYLGYPTLVRGYDGLDASECIPNATSSCPAFDRLFGSRLLVGNLEFRFPLLRPFTGVSPKMYGPVPVEVALFTDAGVAWAKGARPNSSNIVSSAGVAFRVNLLRYVVGQFDVARPFDRPNKGWVFQFSLSPGF